MKVAEALEVASLMDVGQHRIRNEDALASDASIGLCVLADGMGGYRAGEVASEIAVAIVIAQMSELMQQAATAGMVTLDTLKAYLTKAVAQANHAICRISWNQPQCAGMGTTLVLALFHDNQLIAGHVGDSRLYRLRDGLLEQLTEDHSLLQEQINLGLISREQARTSAHRNLVTRALGGDTEVELTLNQYAVNVGDLYLLCSDGLTDMLEDGVIRAALVEASDSMEKAVTKLVHLANAAGGMDNIAVMLVRIKQDYAIKS